MLTKFLIKNIISLLFALLIMQGISHAQQLDRQEIINAYIYNFAKNIEWQNEDQISEFHFKIISEDQKIIEQFRKISQGRKLKGKEIKISGEAFYSNTDNVQLIFVAADKEDEFTNIFDRIEGKNILLVSDNYSDKRVVMINFIETEDKKLQFEINKANILNQGISLLPEMVLLGGTEIDVAEIYRESQQSLRSMQKQVEALNKNEKELEKKIAQWSSEIEQQKEIIENQTASIDSQKIQIAAQEKVSQRLLNEIIHTRDDLEKQTETLIQREKELEQQRKEIKSGEFVLVDQKIEIESQRKEIEIQTETLEKQMIRLTSQKYMIYFMSIIILLVLGLILTIYRGSQKSKKVTKVLAEQKSTLEDTLMELEMANHALKEYHTNLEKLVDERTEKLNKEITERMQIEKELIKHREHLEELISERTKELKEKNLELEKFNKLFVGREFRIKELKDKVKEMEKIISRGK